MINTSNYSQSQLIEVNKNFEFLTDSSTTSQNRLFSLGMELDVDFNRLEDQATVFANNYSTHGYINFYKTLRVDQSKVQKTLFKLYIYSFMKAIHNGLFYDKMSERQEMGLAFFGHASLFHILRSPRSSKFDERLYLEYNIDLGSEKERKALIARLMSKFKFLAEYYKSTCDALGTRSFWISEYESYLNALAEDYYSRPHVVIAGALSDNGEQEGNNSNVSSRNLQSYPNGKLHLVELNKDVTRSITMFNNSPIMNCFESCSDGKLYFMPVKNGKLMEYNSSFSFNRANFIKLSSKNNDFDKIRSFYLSFPLNEDKLYHLICSDVYTITGIKCRSAFKTVKRKKDPISKDDLLRGVEESSKDLFKIIFEKISDKVINSQTIPEIGEIISEVLGEIREGKNRNQEK